MLNEKSVIESLYTLKMDIKTIDSIGIKYITMQFIFCHCILLTSVILYLVDIIFKGNNTAYMCKSMITYLQLLI